MLLPPRKLVLRAVHNIVRSCVHLCAVESDCSYWSLGSVQWQAAAAGVTS